MPKIGKVAGIDNIHDIYDSQRLFNKLKGRLSQLQDSVDVLNTQIDRVEVLKRTQAQAEQNVGEAVVTGYSPALYPPAPIGEEIGGGVGGGVGGGTDPSVTSVSVSVSARKYNEEDNIGSTASCTWIDRLDIDREDYYDDYENDGDDDDDILLNVKYEYIHYYEYQASFTMVNQGDEGDETITLDLYVKAEYTSKSDEGDVGDNYQFMSWRYQPFRGAEMYEESDDSWASTPDWWVLNQFGMDNTTSILYEILNRVEEYSTIPLTEAETEAIALAKSYRWKNESNNPVTHINEEDCTITIIDDDEYTETCIYQGEDSGNDTFSGVSGFHTHIQLRYSVSLGTDVDSIESDAIIPTDNGDNWTSEQIRWYDSGTFTNDYYIDIGVWDTKGNPSSNSIDVILYA